MIRKLILTSVRYIMLFLVFTFLVIKMEPSEKVFLSLTIVMILCFPVKLYFLLKPAYNREVLELSESAASETLWTFQQALLSNYSRIKSRKDHSAAN